MIKKIKRKLRYILFKKQIDQQNQQNQLQHKRCKPWFAVKGDQTLRLNYPLNKDSVVFDLGGYKGEFAADIYNKYQSTIYVFEPIKSFYNIIKQQLADNPKIKAYQYGLAGQNQTMQISLTDNSSSVYITSKLTETIQLKSIVDFIKANNIKHIDLIKINIEGGEYDVLESLIAHNILPLFTDLQIQFHDFIIPNAAERMRAIQNELSKTHQLTYQYEFVWENWTLKQY
ncbi:FkbM family methyltransferase [Olleya marilimosa]|uniref:FkbM family methyltransferase n=1 Tax=Olleya marilimosa TaxID=272164 RepID=A0ABR8LX92_9FLAO|nr:FkbM family methyltransferase [Olleya marilimosa]MBD3863579.1 FkbM family methyltransferase [Olleya marilimosa]